MKVISVTGITKTGKTTTCCALISELRNRGYSVSSVKEIHNEQFAIDTPESNTHKHQLAGSEMVVARGLFETDVLIPKALSINKIIDFFDTDFVVLEGVEDFNCPKIITGKSTEDLDLKYDDRVICVSGVFSNHHDTYKSLSVINATCNIKQLCDLVIAKTPDRMHDFDVKCCNLCGSSCRELLISMINGEKPLNSCVLNNEEIELSINGKQIIMVDFVQKILRNSVLGVVKELDGYQDNKEIVVKINGS